MTSAEPKQPKRWHVVIYYRTDAGVIDHEYELDELHELQEIVERGPNWYALDRIEIRHAWQKGTEIITLPVIASSPLLEKEASA